MRERFHGKITKAQELARLLSISVETSRFGFKPGEVFNRPGLGFRQYSSEGRVETMSIKNTEILLQLGKDLLSKGDFKEAEETFKAALVIYDQISTRNNLALALQKQDKIQEAINILKFSVGAKGSTSLANPYSHALFAQLLLASDCNKEARRHVDIAIKKFEKGIPLQSKQDLTAWLEYTVIIMLTIGELEDHRFIIELYRRWQKYPLLDHARYLAAVAYFNLGRYSSAESLWKMSPYSKMLTEGMRQVALWIDRGDIPPFNLEYEFIPHEEMCKKLEVAAKDEEARRLFSQLGQVRMILLASLLRPDLGQKGIHQMTVDTLVVSGGEWGRDLGQRLLESRSMDKSVKFAAAMALFNIGVYKENEPVPMIIDGKEVEFEINKVMMSFELDQEVREILPVVKKLKEKGQYKEAVALLENLPQNKRFHPQPLIVMANLYRDLKELDKAEEILLLLLDVLPKDPVVLFNLVGLSIQKEDLKQGRSYLDQLDLKGLDDDFKQKVEMLRRHIENKEREMKNGLPFWNVEDAVSAYEEAQRNKVEEKTLPRDTSLLRGLKNMPAIWLDGMLDYHDLDCSGKRQEKEKIIADFLCQKANLADTLEILDEEDVELVQFLLSKGGWARLNIVSRKFGSMEGTGFHWNEENPDSPLAFLWSIGLVMVGRTTINERRCKIAVIPVELREHLQSLLCSQ